jgi:uncharacterized protein (DUF2236 family)
VLTPFLGGGPAVLLQVGHLAMRTLRALDLITFGTKAEAERVGELVRACTLTSPTTKTQLGRFPAGTHCSASDPELMLWDHATLVHAFANT